ncbi:hypothetical protein SK128_024791 [Halocaridina rubra]|uniref:Uncharacterized protein n=1 Tax=Halocaridina rubra TaxID=373956 RepID=A0AAN8X9S0_HALRR
MPVKGKEFTTNIRRAAFLYPKVKISKIQLESNRSKSPFQINSHSNGNVIITQSGKPGTEAINPRSLAKEANMLNGDKCVFEETCKDLLQYNNKLYTTI